METDEEGVGHQSVDHTLYPSSCVVSDGGLLLHVQLDGVHLGELVPRFSEPPHLVRQNLEEMFQLDAEYPPDRTLHPT